MMRNKSCLPIQMSNELEDDTGVAMVGFPFSSFDANTGRGPATVEDEEGWRSSYFNRPVSLSGTIDTPPNGHQ